MESPPPPIADLELLRPIGEGSYGVVWLARNIAGTYRAIKIIRRSNFADKRPLEREFEGMKRFEPVARTHPGLVALLHLGQAPDLSYFYYTMELADDVSSGQKFDPDRYIPHTLSAELSRRGRLPFDECLRIAIALSLALDHLHTRGLVHRDIKPSNIIFVNGVPKLADVGLVAVIDEQRSEVGTRGYYPPPPESTCTAQADIYSFGKVLYQMATGRSVEGYPELPTRLRDESVPHMFLINQIILKACDPDPRARYQTAADLHHALVAAREAAAAGSRTHPHDTATTILIDPTNPDQPAKLKQRSASAFRVTLLYKPNPDPDNHVRDLLKTQLGAHQCEVLTDESPVFHPQNVREMEDNIRHSDAVIVLLSEKSSQSEMLAYEVELARDAGQKKQRPILLVVQMAWTGPLPSPLDALLSNRPRFGWNSTQDDEKLVQDLLATLQSAPAPLPPIKGIDLESGNGAVPLVSHFYIERATDHEFQRAIHRRDSIILIKGARQMGKTSLLARGLQQARAGGGRVVLTDFQKFRSSDLASVESFYRALGDFLAASLNLSVLPDAAWDNRRNPTINFERYLSREVLGDSNRPLIWGMDEVDRLFACDFGSEIFGLFRSWHNERSTNPTVPWSRMTLAIAYATEAHLFITDVNQSPFNVGTRIDLEDFTLSQIEELNGRYNSPLKSDKDIVRLHKLLGGHPYLLRQAFNHLASDKLTLDALMGTADHDNGIFADHLRRILVLLARDPVMTDIVRGILRGRACPDASSFYRLRSAGLIKGDSFQKVDLRCELYATYLRRHLL